jgi:hypothetical protein
MRRIKHIQQLIDLIKDIRKELSPTVIGFVYSAALVHMFHIAFYAKLEPGRAVKHTDFRSSEKIEILKKLIDDFPGKNKMFELWREFENKRNELCYGYPDKDDIEDYAKKFLEIKSILEKVSGISFEIENLEKLNE